VNLLVTGGAGFIGSSFVRLALDCWPDAVITVVDKLSYAGTLENLKGVLNGRRVRFIQGDIADAAFIGDTVPGHSHIVNLAAETHVDRSLLDASDFIHTNVEGVRVLLTAAVRHDVERFLQVGTDEVYGEILPPAVASETDALRPRSPYAASKAGADLLVGAYHASFGLHTLITRGANTYGPRQYPEKLVPLAVTNALDGLPVPVYGDGRQVRDWLYVEDHCRGLADVLERGEAGGIYNLGTGNETSNLEMVRRTLDITAAGESLIRHVADRPGHDRRYALDSTRASALGWSPRVSLEAGLERTVAWYRDHRSWWEPIKRGEFAGYYERQYGKRLGQVPGADVGG
jgi:dTDP-glucose 4,6-dehydratase